MWNRRQTLGAEGERAAALHLRQARYTILERNYRCPFGEVDLIALDGRTVVFVEVKTRRGEGFGSPLDAVTASKQRHLTRVAQHYLLGKRLLDRDVRFDVVGVWWENGRPRCELIQNAFGAEL